VGVKHQKITKRFAVYCGDCCEVLPDIPAKSVGFSIFSPPFGDLYKYSDDDADMGNSNSPKEFFEHFTFLVEQLRRVMMPGRVVAVHCMDLPTFKSHGKDIGVWDFPGAIIRCFEKFNFIQHTPRITIWKDPLLAATRTKAIQLAHKQIVKDSAMCGIGIPDCIVTFRTPGDNPKPIANPSGLVKYHGKRSVPKDLDKWEGFDGDQRKNKRSHWIWQQYASPVWFDIRQTRVLKYREARDNDDEKHICPLQLDTIERCLALWSREDDIVLTPFMGVGSEVYCAVKNKRRAIGIELKESYYRQALKNMANLERKVKASKGFQLGNT